MRRGMQKELGFLAFLYAVFLLIRGERFWGRICGVLASELIFLPATNVSSQLKSVVITGYSRGLGLALAARFLKEGAFVSILAWDHDELQQADLILRSIW